MSILQNNSLIFTNKFPVQTGSVGGFFYLDDTGDIYGITNFHVIQHNGAAAINDAIFQAGNKIQIGSLKYWYTLNEIGSINYFDLALFKIDRSVTKPLWNIKIKGFAEAAAADSVELHRGNGVIRFGKSFGILSGPFSIVIGGQTFQFSNLLKIRSLNTINPFSEPGDSGSIIIAENKIIGLLIGCDPNDPFISYAIPFVDSLSNRGILNYLALKPT